MDYKFINAMTKQVKINAISENKLARWTTEAKHEHMEKLANLSVPTQEFKAKYKQLLVKHFSAKMTLDKSKIFSTKHI